MPWRNNGPSHRPSLFELKLGYRYVYPRMLAFAHFVQRVNYGSSIIEVCNDALIADVAGEASPSPIINVVFVLPFWSDLDRHFPLSRPDSPYISGDMARRPSKAPRFGIRTVEPKGEPVAMASNVQVHATMILGFFRHVGLIGVEPVAIGKDCNEDGSSLVIGL